MIQQCKKQMKVKITEFTVRQKVQCCYWLADLKFPVSVQRQFRQEYGQDPLDRHTIMKWHKKLLQTGSVSRKKEAKNKLAIAARIETVWEAFQCSLSKSTRWASAELHIPHSTVHKIVHKRLKLKTYKIHLAQKLQHDKPKWNKFAPEMLSCLVEGNDFLNHVTFHTKPPSIPPVSCTAIFEGFGVVKTHMLWNMNVKAQI